MKKHFYSKIINIESIIIELQDLNITEDERNHLIKLAEDNIHQEILDMILSNLSEYDKKVFLLHVANGSHDKVWKHLNSKVEDIEDKIVSTAEEIKKHLHKDIKEIKA